MASVTLVPILPSQNHRYVLRTQPERSGDVSFIPSCTSSASLSDGKPPLPRGFRWCTHPEGDGYGFNEEKRLLTPSDIRDHLVMRLILGGSERLRQSLYIKTGDRLGGAELFLDVGAGGVGCIELRYYFVDHSTRQVFWLHDVPLRVLGLPALNTRGEISSVLTPEYWTHVEHFPVHLAVRRRAEEELVAILSYGSVDDAICPHSTFPLGAAECERYLKVIEHLQLRSGRAAEEAHRPSAAEMAPVAYRNAVIARLWNAVARARYVNAYGLDHVRLDRLQGVDEFTMGLIDDSFVLRTFETLSFGLSKRVFLRIASLLNGRVLYHRHWLQFFDDMRGDWSCVTSMSLCVWLATSVLAARGTLNIPFFLVVVTSGASASVGLILCHVHRRETLSSGNDISRYVTSVESGILGLRALSIICVLPHVLAIYAAAAFTLALSWMMWQEDHRSPKVLVLVIVLAACGVVPVFATIVYFDRSLQGSIASMWNCLSGLGLTGARYHQQGVRERME